MYDVLLTENYNYIILSMTDCCIFFCCTCCCCCFIVVIVIVVVLLYRFGIVFGTSCILNHPDGNLTSYKRGKEGSGLCC